MVYGKNYLDEMVKLKLCRFPLDKRKKATNLRVVHGHKVPDCYDRLLQTH